MIVWRLACAVATLAAVPALAAAVPASPAGRWITQDGSAMIAIDRCGDAWCGRIVRVLRRDPAAPVTDIRNPDPRLRARRADSIVILSGFVADGERWRGRIYDPRSGRSYRSFLTLRDPGTLDVRGCVLMLCAGQIWQRDMADR